MPAVDRSADHQRKFKHTGKSGEELRRRRAEGSVELRKTRKDDQLMKKRNVDLDDVLDTSGEKSDLGEISSPDVSQKAKAVKSILPLHECMRIFRDEPKLLSDAVESIRRSLSRQANPAVDEVIKAGALPYLVDALDKADPKIQFEAGWALTNISSGTSLQTRQVVSLGAVPKFVRLLDSDHFYVAEQVCWALGNICGDCAELRDLVIECGILAPLLRLCTKPITADFVKTLSWTISNLCRNKNPMPPEEAVEQLLPIVTELLDYSDSQVKCDACWAAAYLSDATDDRIALVINHGVVQKLAKFLISDDVSLIAPALRCLGNIVTGDDHQTQVVIDSGVLGNITAAMVRGNRSVITKEAMWLLSNIVAGNAAQIQAVLDANLFPVVLEILKKGDSKSQYEACWVIANLTSGGTDDQVTFMLEQFHDALFYSLCDLLKAKEPKMVCLSLDCIANLLHNSEKIGSLEKSLVTVEECGGLDKVESLQSDPNEDVYHKSLSIIERFFNQDEETVESHTDKETHNGSSAQNVMSFDLSLPVDTSNTGGFQF